MKRWFDLTDSMPLTIEEPVMRPLLRGCNGHNYNELQSQIMATAVCKLQVTSCKLQVASCKLQITRKTVPSLGVRILRGTSDRVL